MGHSGPGNASVETPFSGDSRLQLPVKPDEDREGVGRPGESSLPSNHLPHSRERSLTEWVDEFILFMEKKMVMLDPEKA